RLVQLAEPAEQRTVAREAPVLHARDAHQRGPLAAQQTRELVERPLCPPLARGLRRLPSARPRQDGVIAIAAELIVKWCALQLEADVHPGPGAREPPEQLGRHHQL